MTRFGALVQRELMAYFYAPVPYLVIFLFLLMTHFFFMLGMQSGPMGYVPVSYRPVFDNMTFTLLFLIPMLTMNSVAEERSHNTLETLLTAPVQDWQVIGSKWLATCLFFTVMLLPTLVYLPILSDIGSALGKPDMGPVLTGYVGALFLGGMYISIGIFASSLTENALLSAFVAFFLSILLLVPSFLISDEPLGDFGSVTEYINPASHFGEFLAGKIAIVDVLYFTSVIGLFLFLAVRALESRKWR